jgi:hypothetical protein
MAEYVAASWLSQLWVSSIPLAGRDKELRPARREKKKRDLSALLLGLRLFFYSEELPAEVGPADGGEPSESEDVTGKAYIDRGKGRVAREAHDLPACRGRFGPEVFSRPF